MKRLFKYLGYTLLFSPALAWADTKATVGAIVISGV